jgi:hypothetical protein
MVGQYGTEIARLPGKKCNSGEEDQHRKSVHIRRHGNIVARPFERALPNRAANDSHTE